MNNGRTRWLVYMLGYMTSKGWKLTREAMDDFRDAFPEIPQEYIDLVLEEEK